MWRTLGLLIAVVAAAACSEGRAPAAQCVIDDDCELVPVVTCCEECAPVPPFHAVPRSVIDTLLLETEERCLRDERPCARCARPPRGCIAAARCERGRCVVHAVGCGRPSV